ncbi:MAG: outer membrane beta-barrel protein [Rhodospirillaceae bacterium]
MSWGTFLRLTVFSAAVAVWGPHDLRAAETVTLERIRLGQHKTYTRVVLEVTKDVVYSVPADDGHRHRIWLAGLTERNGLRRPRRFGIVSNLSVDPAPDSLVLSIETKKQSEILRHFVIPAQDGRPARIVLDIAEVTLPVSDKNPAPLIQLPPPHTRIAVDYPPQADQRLTHAMPASTPTAEPEPNRAEYTAPQPRRAAHRPIEIASATGVMMVFEGDDAGPAVTGDQSPIEVAQSGISVNQWLQGEQGNPNVTFGYQAAPQAPVPAPAPATPVYQTSPTPMYQGTPATRAPRSQPAAQPAYQPSVQPSDPYGYRYRPPAYGNAPYGRSETRPASAQQVPDRREPATDKLTASDGGGQRFFADGDRSPIYFGGGFGASNFETSQTSTSSSDDDTSFYLKGFGGIRINKFFAAEFALARVGTVEINGAPSNRIDETTYAASLSGVFALPISDSITPFARGGFHLWYKDQETSSDQANGETSGADFIIGLGADVKLAEKFYLRAEWERYFVDTDEADVFSSSVIFGF